MKFSNFGSVVETYKKNFLIRKKKFIIERKVAQAQKKKNREDKIEAVKEVKPLVKFKGGTSKKLNFLGDIKKFLGFALAGFILNNLETILPILQEIIKKLSDIVKGTREFVNNVITTFSNIFDGFDDVKQKMEDLLSPILNADISEFGLFQDKLDSLLAGILTIAGRIVGADPNLPPNPTTPPSTTGSKLKPKEKAQLRSRISAKQSKGAAIRSSARVAATSIRDALERAYKLPSAQVGSSTPALPGTPPSPGSGLGVKITPNTLDTFTKNIDDIKLKQALSNTDDIARAAIEELAKRDAVKGMLDDFLFNPDVTPKPVSPLEKLFGKPSTSPALKTKFSQVMKNAKGFFKPSNLTSLAKFGRDFGIGVLLEFSAGWLLDRGFEKTGFDDRSIIQRRVLEFNKFPKEKQKKIVEKYNEELEKELKYRKSFMGGIDKVIALGDMTTNEKKIKMLAGFLTAISVSGASAVYDMSVLNSDELPDYIRDEIKTTLPFEVPHTGKITLPSSMPSLPPTGTLGTGAQAYGAPRDGGARKHAGVDFDPSDDKNSKFYSRIGGEVIFARNVGGGYGNVVDIFNSELGFTERIAEGNTIHVKEGDIVKPGTLVQSGSEKTGVFHYEIRKGRAGESGSFAGTVDPLQFLEKLMKNSQLQSSIQSSSSSLISSAGLDQSTTYSSGGIAIKREVNNILIPINA